MQAKQKVTLYLPPELHRQLKIRSAIDLEPMSELAERALVFYLENQELVEEAEAIKYGRTHRVYACPECATSVVLRDGEMIPMSSQPAVVGADIPGAQVQRIETNQEGEEQLVPC